MIAYNSLIHVNWSDWISLDLIPLDTILLQHVMFAPQNVGHIRCMHARPHRRKDQLPQRSLRDLRFS